MSSGVGPPSDDRDFIQRTFDGLYFTAEDRAFLDSAWSHIDRMRGQRRALAISALVLAAARKQPRGVFTVTGLRLEGLAIYWRGATILETTRTKKLAKRYTPFSYKRTVAEARRDTFKLFARSTIVLSYSSNVVPDAETIEALLWDAKGEVEVRELDHRYHFGTHAQAERRAATEYVFVGR